MNKFVFLGKHINLEQNVINAIVEYYNANKFCIDKESDAFLCKKRREELRFEDKLHSLTLVTTIAIKVKKIYDELIIADAIYYATMSDIGVWEKQYESNSGKIGLENTDWIYNHLVLNIFKIGRLQFMMNKVPFNFMKRVKGKVEIIPYFKDGLNIHIPRGEKLNIEECRQNISTAKMFFKDVFPNYNYHCMYTISWLLHPNLLQCLPEKSNIRDFQSLFNVLKYNNDVTDVLFYLYGKTTTEEFKNLEEDNEFRKKVKYYLINEGKLGLGYGIIKE